MKTFADYVGLDGMALSALIKAGDVSAWEVLSVALSRLQAVNPTLNAVVGLYEDLLDAEKVNSCVKNAGDSLLAGVPFLLKDLLMPMKGQRMSNGSRLLESYRAERSSELVERYCNAGLVIFGRTATPEFGLSPSTEPVLWGPCRNPWNLGCSPGGSSGGAAVAVAAGIVPLANATDGGGSIRIPASACGLFGLKPSRGINSSAPNFFDWGGLSVAHAVTRTVRDSAALLDISTGYHDGDPYRIALPATGYHRAMTQAPPTLRIAFSTQTPNQLPVDSDCKEAVLRAAELCASLGHHVEEGAPTYNADDLAYRCAIVIASYTQVYIDTYLEKSGRSTAELALEVPTVRYLEMMRRHTATDMVKATQIIYRSGAAIAPFFKHYDVWLTPSLAQPPLALGVLQCEDAVDVSDYFERIAAFTPFTGLANASGQPAMSVPLHWNGEGLPIGVQFLGRMGEDSLLLQLAGQLEQASPWFDKLPCL